MNIRKAIEKAIDDGHFNCTVPLGYIEVMYGGKVRTIPSAILTGYFMFAVATFAPWAAPLVCSSTA